MIYIYSINTLLVPNTCIAYRDFWISFDREQAGGEGALYLFSKSVSPTLGRAGWQLKQNINTWKIILLLFLLFSFKHKLSKRRSCVLCGAEELNAGMKGFSKGYKMNWSLQQPHTEFKNLTWTFKNKHWIFLKGGGDLAFCMGKVKNGNIRQSLWTDWKRKISGKGLPVPRRLWILNNSS